MPFGVAVVEGAMEERIAERLAQHFGFSFRAISNKGGGGKFWKDVARFDQAARNTGPLLGLVDLETAVCASGLIVGKLGRMPHPNFALRVAVRMAESWLLADRAGIAAFLGVKLKEVPAEPEKEADPKQRLVQLARGSKRREVRERIAPAPDQIGGKVGREYLPAMSEFVRNHWNIGAAAAAAPSLRRALNAIEQRL